MDNYVDTLFRADSPAAQAQSASADAKGEMSRLFTSSFRNGGELKSNDRDYVSKVVAARTGMSPADADKRATFVKLTSQLKNEVARINQQISDFLNYSRPAKADLRPLDARNEPDRWRRQRSGSEYFCCGKPLGSNG